MQEAGKGGFQAVRLFSEGGRRVSRLVSLTLDDLDPGEVVIRAQYAAVNYKDARAVTGEGNVVKRFPCIPGIEVSGVVVSSRETRWREGDVVSVQGGPDFGIRHDGAYSEFVRVPGAWVHRVPQALGAFGSVALGIAAYTAAVAVERMIALGVGPSDGPIAVTGATGGCQSFVIDILAGLGYRVVAFTGKTAERDYLVALGAAQVLGRDAIAPGTRPLEEQRWAGCIDAVGGAPLDAILRTMRKGGVVCAYGNAAGESLATSIYPFILRSVTLAGVNANHPIDQRGPTWEKLQAEWRPRHLDRIVQTIPFDALFAHCAALESGTARGRTVVRFGVPAAA